ncbi:MAG: hypothetical protein BIFFINMI_00521 [Phycisphaerae bacterium]|nr:hypothetical protein [Phycisphaerae bacterium]
MRVILKKLGYGTAAIVLLFGAVFAIGYARQNSASPKPPDVHPPAVRVQQIDLADYPFIETFYGQLEPWKQVELSFEYAGTVAMIRVPEGASQPEGQQVRRGDRLIALDGGEQAKDLERARSGLAQALAAVGLTGSQADALCKDPATLRQYYEPAAAADPAIQEADAGLQFAQDEHDRIAGLYDPDPSKSRASKTEMNRAQSEVSRAKAVLRGARQGFDARWEQVKAAFAAADLAAIRLGKTELKAPIDGFVTDVAPEVGEIVSPAVPAVELMDLSRVKAVVGVVDSRVGRLHAGQQVTLTIESLRNAVRLAGLGVGSGQPIGGGDGEVSAGLSQTWPGTVLRVPERENPDTSLFMVEVEVANRFVRVNGQDCPLLRPGMIVRADIVVDRQPVFRVPQSATVRDREGLAFYLLADTTPPTVRRVGIDPDATVLLDGCYLLGSAPAATTQPDRPGPAGASVIVEGQHNLSDNATVTVE